MSLKQPAKAAERAELALSLEGLFGEVLAELRKGKGLASFAMCVK